MKIIKEFKWCRKYNLDHVEVEFDIWNHYVIIYRAKKIRHPKHMIEVIQWARQYSDYEFILGQNILYIVLKWLIFNYKNNNIDYLKFV